MEELNAVEQSQQQEHYNYDDDDSLTGTDSLEDNSGHHRYPASDVVDPQEGEQRTEEEYGGTLPANEHEPSMESRHLDMQQHNSNEIVHHHHGSQMEGEQDHDRLDDVSMNNDTGAYLRGEQTSGGAGLSGESYHSGAGNDNSDSMASPDDVLAGTMSNVSNAASSFVADTIAPSQLVNTITEEYQRLGNMIQHLTHVPGFAMMPTNVDPAGTSRGFCEKCSEKRCPECVVCGCCPADHENLGGTQLTPSNKRKRDDGGISDSNKRVKSGSEDAQDTTDRKKTKRVRKRWTQEELVLLEETIKTNGQDLDSLCEALPHRSRKAIQHMMYTKQTEKDKEYRAKLAEKEEKRKAKLEKKLAKKASSSQGSLQSSMSSSSSQQQHGHTSPTEHQHLNIRHSMSSQSHTQGHHHQPHPIPPASHLYHTSSSYHNGDQGYSQGNVSSLQQNHGHSQYGMNGSGMPGSSSHLQGHSLQNSQAHQIPTQILVHDKNAHMSPIDVGHVGMKGDHGDGSGRM